MIRIQDKVPLGGVKLFASTTCSLPIPHISPTIEVSDSRSRHNAPCPLMFSDQYGDLFLIACQYVGTAQSNSDAKFEVRGCRRQHIIHAHNSKSSSATVLGSELTSTTCANLYHRSTTLLGSCPRYGLYTATKCRAATEITSRSNDGSSISFAMAPITTGSVATRTICSSLNDTSRSQNNHHSVVPCCGHPEIGANANNPANTMVLSLVMPIRSS